MTESRNALDVPAVMDRFTASEQLLNEAATRVRALGDAAESAAADSGALRQAAQSLTETARMMGELVADLRAAHQAVGQTMSLARQFLETTDVSAVRELLQRLEQRVSGLEQAAAGVTEQITQSSTEQDRRLRAILAAVDRSAALEQARDAAQQQLSSVLAQLPARIVKKVAVPTP
jgi:DNA-binding ferritin-like protein